MIWANSTNMWRVANPLDLCCGAFLLARRLGAMLTGLLTGHSMARLPAALGMLQLLKTVVAC